LKLLLVISNCEVTLLIFPILVIEKRHSISSVLYWCVSFLDSVVLVIVHPEVKNWLKYARFEEKNQFISSARQIYERAVEYFGDEYIDEGLLIAFAKFEEGQREVSIVSCEIFFIRLYKIACMMHQLSGQAPAYLITHTV